MSVRDANHISFMVLWSAQDTHNKKEVATIFLSDIREKLKTDHPKIVIMHSDHAIEGKIDNWKYLFFIAIVLYKASLNVEAESMFFFN